MSKKVIVVGDGACGKTCLIEVFVKDQFNYHPYASTFHDGTSQGGAFGSCAVDIEVDEQTVHLEVWDNCG